MNFLKSEYIDDIRKKIKNKYAQIPKKEDRNHLENDIKSEYDRIAVRNEFSIDRDRILFSKAFRRLEHKAQIYSHEKGDHFRTRLTHTMEVLQIARSIARNLGLNEDLTEAIALGHDIGHTPYGHEGEKVLDKIMDGTDDLGGKIDYKLNFRGFKHNFNSLKILDVLEKKFKDYNGLNLTWQVKEGILRHTKIKKNEDETWPLSRFMEKTTHQHLISNLMSYKDSVSLEGQIVFIADEIAQRQHDIDDGLRDMELKLKESEVIDKIFEMITQERENAIRRAINSLKDKRLKVTITLESGEKKIIDDINPIKKELKKRTSMEEIYNQLKKPQDIVISDETSLSARLPLLPDENLLLDELAEKIEKREKDRILCDNQLRSNITKIVNYLKIDSADEKKVIKKLSEFESCRQDKLNDEILREDEYRWNSLVRDIIDYFIKDITINSLSLVKKDENSFFYDSDKKLISNKLIDLSDTAKNIDKQIKRWIDNRIVNSYNVNRFDGKATFIVRQLFKAYYANPRQMPKIYLRILREKIRKNSKNYALEIQIQKNPIDDIKFKSSDPKVINQLVRILQLSLSKSDIEKLLVKKESEFKSLNIKLDEEFLKKIGGKDLTIYKKNCEECNQFDYEKRLLYEIFGKINNLNKDNINQLDTRIIQQTMLIKCLIENHYAFMSVICDHISGMTDNFANEEYRKLYLV